MLAGRSELNLDQTLVAKNNGMDCPVPGGFRILGVVEDVPWTFQWPPIS
jgi:hypothetical protein